MTTAPHKNQNPSKPANIVPGGVRSPLDTAKAAVGQQDAIAGTLRDRVLAVLRTGGEWQVRPLYRVLGMSEGGRSIEAVLRRLQAEGLAAPSGDWRTLPRGAVRWRAIDIPALPPHGNIGGENHAAE